jgi:hypothetical protein
MESQLKSVRRSSKTAAASQTQIHNRRAEELPRKLPADWAERYIAKEFKVVALRECPLSKDLRLCDAPDKAAEYWRLNVATNPYFNNECECLAVLILNSRHHVKGHQLVTIGTLDTMLCHAREVFRTAIIASASAIILMHNHPSGDARPSEADIKVTRDLTLVGQLMRIDVLDHVVMGQPAPMNPRGYTSLRELGYFVSSDDITSLPRRDGRSRKHQEQHDQRRAA